MVIEFGDNLLHERTSFLASNLIGHVEIDPTKSSTSTSEANYVASSDISDKRYLCDVPLSNASNCSCSVGSKGLVGSGGRTFPGSSINADGTQTAVVGPLGIKGPVDGVPHPSFRFAQKVTDVNVHMEDITIPGKERVIWDAKFRLTGPDGSLGSDYLPSSLPPIGGYPRNFHKMCSALNSWRMYKLNVEAGGDAPISQTIVMKASIVKPTKLIHPLKAGQKEAKTGNTGASLKRTGPRLFKLDGDAPATDSASAVRNSSFATSFACRYEALGEPGPDTYAADRTILIKPQMSGFPSLTATSFAAVPPHKHTAFNRGGDDGCGCDDAPTPTNPPGCHKPPTVTIHMPRTSVSGFL